MNQATNIYGSPYHRMDTRLTTSRTFSRLTSQLFCEVGIIIFPLKLRNCYFKSLTDLAKVTDLVTRTPRIHTQSVRVHSPWPFSHRSALLQCMCLFTSPFPLQTEVLNPGYILGLPWELLKSIFAQASPRAN